MSAVAATVIAALMAGNAPAFVEDLDDLAGQTDIDLGADQSMRHGIEEFLDLDMIVGTDPGKLPDRELISFGGQSLERWPLHRFEEVLAADIKPPHGSAVEIVEGVSNGGIALGKREESLMTQPPENVRLGQAHPSFDFCLAERRQMQVMSERPAAKSGLHIRFTRCMGMRSSLSIAAIIGVSTGSSTPMRTARSGQSPRI